RAALIEPARSRLPLAETGAMAQSGGRMTSNAGIGPMTSNAPATAPHAAPGTGATIDPAKLDRLAAVAVRVGLNLQPGQDLLLTAPVAALPLVRLIAKHAYQADA